MEAKILFLLFGVALLVQHQLIVQTTFQCYYIEHKKQDTVTDEYKKYDGGEDSSVFKVNSENTLITHIAENGAEAKYNITEKWNFSDKGIWMFGAIGDEENSSDAAEVLLYMFDFKKKEIDIMNAGKPGAPLTVYYVESILINDE